MSIEGIGKKMRINMSLPEIIEFSGINDEKRSQRNFKTPRETVIDLCNEFARIDNRNRKKMDVNI